MTDGSLVRSDLRQRVVDGFAKRPLGHGVQPPRSQSYDHCFNYFADIASPCDDMEKSCAVLGIYLASWGMYRGSSHLLKNTNSSHLMPVVEYVAANRAVLNKIDVDCYSSDNIQATINAYEAIKAAVLPGSQSHLTLVTKIMIAVFGCVPAFDTYVLRGCRKIFEGDKSVSTTTLTVRSLSRVADFYRANQAEVDALHHESRTVTFGGTAVTGHKLTKAKIVDMYCFDLGS